MPGAYIPDDYIAVKRRLQLLYADHPTASIITDILAHENGFVLARARIQADDRTATAHAWGKLGEEKALEKVETAAVGRACVHLGYPATESELEKATSEKRQRERSRIVSRSPASASLGRGDAGPIETLAYGEGVSGSEASVPASSSEGSPSPTRPGLVGPSDESPEAGVGGSAGEPAAPASARPYPHIHRDRDPQPERILKGYIVCECPATRREDESWADIS